MEAETTHSEPRSHLDELLQGNDDDELHRVGKPSEQSEGSCCPRAAVQGRPGWRTV